MPCLNLYTGVHRISQVPDEAKMIENAVLNTISKGFTTPDLGGKCSTDQAGQKITDELRAIRRAD